MKKIICLLILVIPIIAFTQSEISWYSIPDESDHVIKKGYNNSNELTNRYYKKNNSMYRTIEFDISFNGGTFYELTGGDATFQNNWNKIMTLACTANSQSRNSIRLGWRHKSGSDKIEVGYYAHINHFGEGSDEIGREYTPILELSKYEVAHVEMVLSKYDIYLRVNDIGVHIYRDVISWDTNGEETIIHVNAFFGDGRTGVFDEKVYKASENMHFSLTNIIVDLNIYWENKWQNEAPYLKFMNSRFHYGVNETFIGTKQIETSTHSESRVDQSHNLSERVNNNFTFTEFEPGSTVEMISPDIILRQGTIIQYGAIAYFGQNYMKNESIRNFDYDTIKVFSFNENYNTIDSLLLFQGDTIYKTKHEEQLYPIQTFDENIKIFPNPVKDIVKITTNIYTEYTIDITTSNGSIIYSNTLNSTPEISFNISSFSSGTYYCIIKKTDGTHTTLPFIKL